MTRIVAGSAGGRRLAVPPKGTRPTSDRVREALFAALDHDPGLDGCAVLDLCAGSGALGLEALSRGAVHALFVESDRRAADVLRRNVSTLGLGGVVRAAPAAAVLGTTADRPYDVVLIDPPYEVPDAEIAGWLTAAAAHGWLAADATVVVERRASRTAFPWPPPLESARERRYGDTVLHVAHCYGSGS
ncbi:MULTISPECIES: 16S rRNA (guanine(966)-N(2))-methyltransferase RsmD [unclassified Pseudonocardia]|jgi:16S rRNA (guanine966-N2)-methyltransferase|uniref:16S rRNA (guanine(966)-N(2))-methyltransferase RsmD n=1 Tax=unclassified Pseudonocardia TaxID=2619320 RepID=UPI00095CBF40|nr:MULTISPECIES: 16S rRNA (guanine(966)-N(2))-methyltransferase RsmD [unclassified Pseudonocardia]MBN9101425.1 16S rRNA (guanine(966)-N(2))-methyltransferase RsmD [Pseudonocardia sp.]OJY47215.1 MAG: 16S rRNA (guanine(966)-N(2))-methyltransferase RsmD [Pseudonocardia sp. 73-21]